MRQIKYKMILNDVNYSHALLPPFVKVLQLCDTSNVCQGQIPLNVLVSASNTFLVTVPDSVDTNVLVQGNLNALITKQLSCGQQPL
jgi:hypothetical protein